MSISQAELIRSLESLSVGQLDQLVGDYTSRLGLPRPQAPVLLDRVTPPEPPVAPDSFSVTMTSAGANKIALIKVFRELFSLGLKEAKEAAERPVPYVVREDLSRDEARTLAAQLIEAGARVEIKP